MSNDAIKTIGSSSVGAILGLSPWAGPWDVWARMHGLVESKKRAQSLAQSVGYTLDQTSLCRTEKKGGSLKSSPPAHSMSTGESQEQTMCRRTTPHSVCGRWL